MQKLKAGSVDLVFADPPFNIGYAYDLYDDSIDSTKYLDWSRDWISGVHRVLKDDGTFWLAIGDEYAAELKVISREVGFHCRSWVVWYYTFGVNCSAKFTRSHAHLFYFLKDPKNFVFLADDPQNRVPSARELVYNDKRANPLGRLPDDTWIIRPADVVGDLTDEAGNVSLEALAAGPDEEQTFTLRPQDLENCFSAGEDTWYFPRVAGTFKERAGFHGCQMPEQLLGRIIRSCSHPGDLVLDPFAGSSTTLAVAKKLGRDYLGFDLSPDYIRYGKERLNSIAVGDPLDGSAEPTKSAPQTYQKRGKQAGAKKQPKAGKKATKKSVAIAAVPEIQLSEADTQSLLHEIYEAFRLTHEGFSVDRVVTDPHLNLEFTSYCHRQGLAGNATTWNTLLLRLRKAGTLSNITTRYRTNMSWEQCDAYVFASEIAVKQMLNQGLAGSLDQIFCDPQLALEFDKLAATLAPGFRSLEYRWAALKLRKASKAAAVRAESLGNILLNVAVPAVELMDTKPPAGPGVYLVGSADGETLYAGEAANLSDRLARQFALELLQKGEAIYGQPVVQWHALADYPAACKLAWQCRLSKDFQTRFNFVGERD